MLCINSIYSVKSGLDPTNSHPTPFLMQISSHILRGPQSAPNLIPSACRAEIAAQGIVPQSPALSRVPHRIFFTPFALLTQSPIVLLLQGDPIPIHRQNNKKKILTEIFISCL